MSTTRAEARPPIAVLTAGIVPAPDRRPWAHLIDSALATLAGVATLVAVVVMGLPAWLAALLAVVALIAVILVLASRLTRVGQTPGCRWLGLRVVDDTTGLPQHFGRANGGALVADLREGRDPLRLQPTPTTSTTPTAETGRWQDLGESRRVAATLTIDDGTTFSLTTTTLIGRDPVPPEGSDWETHAIPDLTRTISKNHAVLEPDAAGLWVTDLGSTNGTTVMAGGRRQLLDERSRVLVPHGARVAVGSRLVLVTQGKGEGA